MNNSPYRKNVRPPPKAPWEHNDMFSDHILCPNCAGMRLLVGIPLLCFVLVQLGWLKSPPPPQECVPGDCVRQVGGMFHHECLEWCPQPVREIQLSPQDRKLLVDAIVQGAQKPDPAKPNDPDLESIRAWTLSPGNDSYNVWKFKQQHSQPASSANTTRPTTSR